MIVYACASYHRHDSAASANWEKRYRSGLERAGMELQRRCRVQSGKACSLVQRDLQVAFISGRIRTRKDGEICWGANSQDRARGSWERAAKTVTDRLTCYSKQPMRWINFKTCYKVCFCTSQPCMHLSTSCLHEFALSDTSHTAQYFTFCCLVLLF